jgi:hypothetical protein
MLMSPVGLRPEKVRTGDAQQKLETTNPISRQRVRGENLVVGPKSEHDTKTHWPIDRRS